MCFNPARQIPTLSHFPWYRIDPIDRRESYRRIALHTQIEQKRHDTEIWRTYRHGSTRRKRVITPGITMGQILGTLLRTLQFHTAQTSPLPHRVIQMPQDMATTNLHQHTHRRHTQTKYQYNPSSYPIISYPANKSGISKLKHLSKPWRARLSPDVWRNIRRGA